MTQPKLHSSLFAAAALVFCAAPLSAQDAGVSAEAASSLLGKRYVGASFGYQDVNHSDRGLFGGAIGLNLPVASSLDVGVGASHSWLEGNNSFHAEEVFASATYYIEQGPLRPFISGTFGHAELSAPGSRDDDFAFYGIDAGAEYQLSDTLSVTGSVGYGDNFESGDWSTWSASVQLNYWLRSDLTVGGGVALIEQGDLMYRVGAAWVF